MRIKFLRAVVSLCDRVAYHAARAEVRAILAQKPVPNRWTDDGQKLCEYGGRLHAYERKVTGEKSMERALISSWMRAGAWDEEVGAPPKAQS